MVVWCAGEVGAWDWLLVSAGSEVGSFSLAQYFLFVLFLFLFSFFVFCFGFCGVWVFPVRCGCLERNRERHRELDSSSFGLLLYGI